MRNQINILFFSLVTLSCAEKFEFEGETRPITVFDAKVSTNPEESRIIVYTIDENGRRNNQSGYIFTVTAGNGTSFEFTESESPEGVIYTNESFIGIEGEAYNMVGVSPEGYSITASETIPFLLPFNIDIVDTTFTKVAGGSILTEAVGYSLNVELDARDRESLYARYNFAYDYVDYFTGRLITVSINDDFTLFNCADNCSILSQSMQLLEDRDWLFVISPCSDDNPPPDLNPDDCLRIFGDYETTFRFRGEYFTKETYEYWRDVERLLNNDGLVFDVFPFPVQSNIQCEECPEDIVGVFQAVSEVKQEFIFFL